MLLPRRELIASTLAVPIVANAQPFPRFIPGPVSSAPLSALVAHGFFRNGGSAFAAINTTGANTLFFAISSSHGSTPVPGDNMSNTFTLAASDLTANPDLRLYYSAGATVGAGHTFTVTGASTLFGATVSAFSGLTATPADTTNHAHSASASTLQAGSVTPTTAKSLVIAAFGYATASTFSINSGQVIDQQTFVSANAYGNASAWITQSGTAALNPTWTAATGPNAATAVIGVFKST